MQLGCDRGFGLLTAVRLNQMGFSVIASCLNAKDSEEKLKKGAKFPHKMHVLQLDVTNQQQLNQALIAVRQLTDDKLYALVNNAGIFRISPIEWGTFDYHVRQVIDINLLATVNVTRTFLPLIRKCQGN